jgi:hypothetical protein
MHNAYMYTICTVLEMTAIFTWNIRDYINKIIGAGQGAEGTCMYGICVECRQRKHIFFVYKNR